MRQNSIIAYKIQRINNSKYKKVVIINKLKMNCETKFPTDDNSKEYAFDSKDRISNSTNDSQTFGLSDSSVEAKQIDMLPPFQPNFNIKLIFQQKVGQSEITPNLHKKSINWLNTFCWTRNYSEEIFWHSVGFYYAYFNSIEIKKERLTLIMISAVNLTLKLYDSQFSLDFQEMKNLINGVWVEKDFRQVETQLIELFKFDLYCPTLFDQIYTFQESEEERYKILFIAQSLFMNNYQSALNDLLLEDILVLVKQSHQDNELKSELMKLYKNPKTMEPLKQKFSSKFDVDDFLRQILMKS